MLMSEEKLFYSAAEVARLLQVSKETVIRMIHRGELEAVRVGRQFRIRHESVDKYLKR